MVMRLTTLCYIENEEQDSYLMLHRIKKKQDLSKDMWIGVGGHFEEGESPCECLLREVKEETGLTLTSYQLRGVITFLTDEAEGEYIFLRLIQENAPYFDLKLRYHGKVLMEAVLNGKQLEL